MADYWRHCLRLIEPYYNASNQQWITSRYAGQCPRYGDVNSARQFSMFKSPYDLAMRNNKIFLTDDKNFKLKQIDMVTDLVSTIYKHDQRLGNLVLGADDGEFYVTVNYGLLHIQDQQASWFVGSTNKSDRTAEGSFSEVGFKSFFDVQWLNSRTLLVVELGASLVKVLDLDSRHITNICTGLLYSKYYVVTISVTAPNQVFQRPFPWFSDESQTIIALC